LNRTFVEWPGTTKLGHGSLLSLPSDALNLAVITHAPITADPCILYQLEDVAWLENLLRSTEIVQKVHDLYEQLGRKKRPRPGSQPD
jgi:hypothetical protein